MASNEEKSTTGNPISGGHANASQNAASANVQDQTLLNALQDLIVRVMNPIQKHDTNPGHLGPEAGKLISALQEFISSIVMRTQSEAQHAIEVNVDDEEDTVQEDEPDDDGDGRSSTQISSLTLEGNAVARNRSINLYTLEKRQSTFEDRLLKALHEHVFNTMPIRLLCFEPHGSSFQIILLERGAIYARLALELERRMNAGEFQREGNRFGGMETDQEMFKRIISEHAQYAILSHTWLRTAPGEVTYGDWKKGSFDVRSPGYLKLVNFCKAAWRDYGLNFGWMDTVCINKESSSELDESIRSMYNWYERAAICIIYLSETGALSNMHVDTWFTRGWTLQELFAPSVIKFYNDRWEKLADISLNDKKDTWIIEQIERATTISRDELLDIRRADVSRRMQLAATREVTREEDVAYSLMGIFDISMSTAYGEGAQRAFFRLLQEIIAARDVTLDILNWAGKLPPSRPYSSQVLPSSPKYYTSRCSDESLIFLRPIEPLTLTHLGLRVPVILMPGISIKNTFNPYDTIGDYNAIVNISPTGFYLDVQNIPTTYHLLNNRVSGKDGMKGDEWFQMTFAVINIDITRNIISLPKTCMAIGLGCNEPAGEVSTTGGFINRVETEKPIVFELTRGAATGGVKALVFGHYFWTVECDDLAKHGMQMISLYL